MKDIVLKKIRDEYNQKKLRAQNEADKIKEMIYKKHPRLEELDTQIALTSIDLSKTILTKPENIDEIILQIKRNLDALKEEKNEILKANNLTQDSFKPNFECNLCEDTGYLENGNRCKCYKQKIIESLYDMSNIKHRLKKENFNSFDISVFSNEKYKDETITPKQNMYNVLDACSNFCTKFDEDVPSFLFYGATGVGKTFMCNCIAADLIERGKTVIYQTASNLIEIIEAHKFGKINETQFSKDNYNYLFECDLLIIDDLGTELNNSFTNSELFNIINARMISDKKMIISTNLSLNELAQTYSERIISRVFNEFATFKFFGKDLRWEIC